MIVHRERAAVSLSNRDQKTYIWFIVVVLVVAALAVSTISYGVRVVVIQRKADIGILGVTTNYAVKLRNQTAFPISFEGVQMPGGYPVSGVWYHYRIEKFDTNTKDWRTVAEINPLTMGKNPVVTKRVWPGWTFYPVTWEATAARDAFQKGDLARFVIFSSLRPASSKGQKIIYSPSFHIEEEPVRRREHIPGATAKDPDR